MTFAEYIEDMDRRAALARALDASPDYLWQIGKGIRKASFKLAKEIEEATGGTITRHDLRSDIFGIGPKAAA